MTPEQIVLDKLREYLCLELVAHEDGTMMSMAESIHGQVIFGMVLQRLDELEDTYEINTSNR